MYLPFYDICTQLISLPERHVFICPAGQSPGEQTALSKPLSVHPHQISPRGLEPTVCAKIYHPEDIPAFSYNFRQCLHFPLPCDNPTLTLREDEQRVQGRGGFRLLGGSSEGLPDMVWSLRSSSGDMCQDHLQTIGQEDEFTKHMQVPKQALPDQVLVCIGKD